MVFSLCAIMSIEQDLNSSRMVLWIRASVLTSTAAVASSRTRIFDLRSSARARLNSCLCPTLKFSPPSDTFTQVKLHLRQLMFFPLLLQRKNIQNEIQQILLPKDGLSLYLSVQAKGILPDNIFQMRSL